MNNWIIEHPDFGWRAGPGFHTTKRYPTQPCSWPLASIQPLPLMAFWRSLPIIFPTCFIPLLTCIFGGEFLAYRHANCVLQSTVFVFFFFCIWRWVGSHWQAILAWCLFFYSLISFPILAHSSYPDRANACLLLLVSITYWLTSWFLSGFPFLRPTESRLFWDTWAYYFDSEKLQIQTLYFAYIYHACGASDILVSYALRFRFSVDLVFSSALLCVVKVPVSCHTRQRNFLDIAWNFHSTAIIHTFRTNNNMTICVREQQSVLVPTSLDHQARSACSTWKWKDIFLSSFVSGFINFQNPWLRLFLSSQIGEGFEIEPYTY
jgi:hypothetical protein